MTGWIALDRLLSTDPRDAGCETAMQLLDVYAELMLLDRETARAHRPDIAAHLLACGPCAEDLEGLLHAIEPVSESEANPGTFNTGT